jgi:hypothetical protein
MPLQLDAAAACAAKVFAPMNQNTPSEQEPPTASRFLEAQPEWVYRSREGLIRAVVWAFIGAFYALLFKTFYVLAWYWSLPVPQIIFGGTAATAVAALIYASMRLAVIISLFSSVFSVGYLVTHIDAFDPSRYLAYVVLLGVAVGTLYGILAKTSRIGYADAKILAGLLAGLITSSAYWLLAEWLGRLEPGWAIAILCPLAGWLYVFLTPYTIRTCGVLLPPTGDGMVVGAGISLFVGLCMWIMAGAVDEQIVASTSGIIEEILIGLPIALGGGIVGGFLAGFLSGALGLEWQDQ